MINVFMYNIVTFNQLYLAALYWNLFAVPITKKKKKKKREKYKPQYHATPVYDSEVIIVLHL